MGIGDRQTARRWLLGVAGLPLPMLVIVLAYRLHEQSWPEAFAQAATAPILLLPLAVFVRYAAQQTARETSVLPAVRSLASGVLMFAGALGVDLVHAGWLENVLDSILLMLGAPFLGEAFRKSAERIVAPVTV
jgi:uncharacterized membrane protein YoaK (UPF0700 family)